MFSGRVAEVGGTRIFARPLADGRQALAYAMRVAQDQELAMILPIPTPVGVAEDAVAFVDLSGAADLFARLDALFPVMLGLGMAQSKSRQSRGFLQVHQVGAFNASFVPRLADFARLDPVLRLPEQVWDEVPGYADFGFCVLALGAPARPRRGLIDRLLGRRPAAAGAHAVHPMAFTFPRRDPAQIFFPTVHVHDGEVHAKATFDHTLYLQAAEAEAGAIDWAWEVSSSVAGRAARDAEAMVAADAHVFRRKLRGKLPNRDQVIAVDAEARRTRIVGPCAVQLDEPWHAADAALLDATMARLAAATATLGEVARPFDAHLPLSTLGAELPPGLPPGFQLHTGPSLMSFGRALPDGRRLAVRVAVHAHPDAAAGARLRAALDDG